jgi:DNA invertase Pin-like site-specific DNA recombinase
MHQNAAETAHRFTLALAQAVPNWQGIIRNPQWPHFLHRVFDTTTPAGKAMSQMMGVFSEFEHAMIQERVRAGLRRAKAEGKRLGRPRIDSATEAAIRKSVAAGMGICKAARTHGVGTAVAQRTKHEIASAKILGSRSPAVGAA